MSEEIIITRGATSPQVIQVARGVAGRMGLSAYELAVLDGFVGSQSEWLASLTEAAAGAEATALAAVAAEAVLREAGDTQGVGGFLSGNLPNPGVNTSALDNAIASQIDTPGSDTETALGGTYATIAALGTKETPAGAQAKVDALGASLPATYVTHSTQGATVGSSSYDAETDAISVSIATPWGVRSDGSVYYDSAGAADGEQAVLDINPTTGAPRVTLIGV